MGTGLTKQQNRKGDGAGERQLLARIKELEAEVGRLTKLIDTPHTADFLEALPLEAAHQLKRFGLEHDAGNSPWDWFWLLGFLAQKAAQAAAAGKINKAKHHTISSAAMLLNWHRRLTGDDKSFRPGIESPERKARAKRKKATGKRAG